MTITSRTNPKIKFARGLHNRKERTRTGMFLVEGIRQVAAAIEHDYRVETLIVTPDMLRSPFAREVVAGQREQGGPILEVSTDVFGSLSLRENPQGIACVAHQRWQSLTDAHVSPEGTGWVALVEPQDPGNLGTILRTCDAAGCDGVILIGNAVEPWHPTALRAATGATFSQRLIRCDFDEFTGWAKQRGYQVVGTSDRAPTDYATAQYPRPMVLLMGSERLGLSEKQQGVADVMVSIPMAGYCDSLNLAVATSLVLFEAHNQHRLPRQ